MAESEFKTFDALYARLFQMYESGEYAQALELATRETERFPERSNQVRLFRAFMAGRLADADLAFKLLDESLADGYWLSQRDWDDEDFDAIRDLPRFAQLRARSIEFLRSAQADAKAELLTILPEDHAAKLPLLVALHGNNSSIRWHKSHWRGAPGEGWLLGMPQSSQVSSLDSEGAAAYVWDDYSWAKREILDHHAALNRAYSVDQEQVVVGGFSRGAEMAIQLAVTGALPVRGFVAVCPGGPNTDVPEIWEPIIAQGEGRDLRGYVIMGGQDRFVAGTEKLVKWLGDAGIKVEFEVHSDMGHDYPPDFGARLGDMLAYVLDVV